MDDFKATMSWAAENKVRFKVEKLPGGGFMFMGKLDRIESEYPFQDTDDLLAAVWTVALAIETGTKFHQKVGFIPEAK